MSNIILASVKGFFKDIKEIELWFMNIIYNDKYMKLN